MKISLLFVFLACCFFVRGQQKNPLPQLNSLARETNLSISPNGKYMYFMSDRGGQPWSEERRTDKETGVRHYDGDLWYSVNVDGEWQAPVCLDNSVNTSEGEDEPVITADGQRVYFQSWKRSWEYSGGPYYMASLKGTVWENPVGLGGEITRFFSELDSRTRIDLVKRLKKKNLYEDYLKLQQARVKEWQDSLAKKGFKTPDFWMATDGMAISPDEKIFIVSVYIPENENYDLLISRKNGEGMWSYPKPLNINSGTANEKSVFIAGDNQTVYFASDRPGGMGGLDIYKTTLSGGTQCSDPENLGTAFNTSKDDNCLILDATGKSGYMVSDGDIVQVSLDISAPRVIVINGVVIDQDSNPVAAEVELLDAAANRSLRKSRSNAHKGDYSFSFLRQEGQYRQLVKAPGGQIVDTLFEVNAASGDVLDFIIVINIPKAAQASVVTALNKKNLRKGEIFRIDQLQFDADSSIIKKTFYPLLDDIARILREKNKLRVEIGGHTNGLPSHEFCDKLSHDRALAVYTYLLKKGVPSANMEYKGYGKRARIASDKTAYGRRLNQRVEIKVLDTGE